MVLSGYPEIYSELIHNQTQIGWEQMFMGRFVTDWSELQQDFLKSKSSKNKKHSGTSWVTGITSVIWKNIYVLWDERNGQQHGIDAIAKENKLNEMALKQIEELYNHKKDVLPRHQELFYDTLEQHQAKEPTSKGLRQWIRTWEPVLLKSVEDAKKFGTRGIRAIGSFFQPKHNT